MILPQPGDAFEWMEAPGSALVCRPLERFARHFFTTRAWPLGSATAGSNLASWNGVARAMDVEPAHLLRVHQVHGASVVVQRTSESVVGGADADIVLSNDPAVALAVQTADCVPLLIADRRTSAIAAAHAGWRGTALGVAQATVRSIAREFGGRPSDLIVAIGPSIGPCCYEVGADVRARFDAAGFSEAEVARWFLSEPQPSAANPLLGGLSNTSRPGHWFFDLWTATSDQLIAAGVPHHQIFGSELCTASHPDAFCFHRRDGSRAGRMVAVIRKAEPQK